MKDKGSLCGQKLTMPTEFIAQNGAEIHETTPISVAGCAKVKALTRAQKLQQSAEGLPQARTRASGRRVKRTARKDFGTKKKGEEQEEKVVSFE